MADGTMVMLPFITTNEDGSTERNWARMRFVGVVNRRRVKREIRKWVKRALGRCIHPVELRAIMKHQVFPLYATD